jgi:hypothetical protein
MPRRRNEVETDRYNVGLPRPVSRRLRALAMEQRLSGPATIAMLVTAALGEGDEDAEEASVQASPLFQRVVREKEELAAALTEVRRQLARQPGADASEATRLPRWAWPMDSLLADAGWWQMWLPRLYELLGSDLGLMVSDRRSNLDERGYVDLMGHLFPPVGGTTWRSPAYPDASRMCAAPDDAIVSNRPRRSAVWEPVVRHVARALAALEATERAGADAYHALRVQAELSGPWIRTLRYLLGESPGELQRLPAADVG